MSGKTGLTQRAAGLTTITGEVTVDTTTPLDVLDNWRVADINDTTADDNDKSFTVPADTERHILWIWVEYTSTGTAGDRQLVVEVQAAGPDVIAQWARAGIVQTASLTRYYQFGPGLPDDIAFRDTDYLRTPIPTSGVLKAGDILRIYENNDVDDDDDMIVHIQYADRGI
jgi:hypothetical protein